MTWSKASELGVVSASKRVRWNGPLEAVLLPPLAILYHPLPIAGIYPRRLVLARLRRACWNNYAKMARLKAETYEGSPCRKFGHTERYVNSGNCAVCARSHGIIHGAIWRKEHPEQYASNQRAWYLANSEY